MLPTVRLSQLCHQQQDVSEEALQSSLGSLTTLTPLRQGTPSPSLEGERNYPAGGHKQHIPALPGSSASVSRTARPRSDKPTVIVQTGQSGGRGRPSMKACDKYIGTKQKIQSHEN